MKLVNSLNNKLKDTFSFRISLFICSLLLIFLKAPQLFLYPRLWAEEATIFYAFARHHSIWEIFTTAHVGYLTLFNSFVSSLQAKVFSVENAATVSTYMGFLIQLMPVYIIAFTTNKFWDNPLKKIVCCFIVIVVLSEELYVNTTNTHFIFGLITFLIMVVSTDGISTFQKYLFRILLFLGGLTGPASIFFTPTFLLKAYQEKKKEKYIQAGILTLCAIIQAFVILYAIFFNNTYKRLSVHDLKTTRYRYIIDNFTMMSNSSLFHDNGQLFSFDLITLFGLMIGTFFVYIFFKNFKKNDYLIAFLSFLIVGTLSTLGSLDMGGGGRYSYIPTCILLIVFLSLFFETKYNYFALCILVFSLSINTIYYTGRMNNWAYKPEYPKWKGEVSKWRADSTYNPVIYPGVKDWKIKM